MWNPQRGRWLAAAGVAAFAAGAVLVWKGIQLTLLLERQAALVFEDSALREARARLKELERAIRAEESSALLALAALPANSTSEAVARALAPHPIVDAPFLLAADRSLAYPSPPGPSLEAIAGEETSPEVFLRARRLEAGEKEAEALGALEAVSAAPELAVPWRLRARAAIAALHLRAGRASQAAAAYLSIETDFREELQKLVRPSRVQLAAAHALALDAAGRRNDARSLVLRVLRGLDLAGLARGDVGVLLRRAGGLADSKGGEFEAELERFTSAHGQAAQRLRFARKIREWIVARLERGGEPGHFAEEIGTERCLVAWTPGGEGSGLLAAGFLIRLPAALEVFRRTLAGSAGDEAGPGGPPNGGDLPLQVELEPVPPAFQELASLPGVLQGFKVGLERTEWEKLRGSARRPFRIAAVLVGALGLVLSLSAGLGLLAIRSEIHLARLKTEFVANVSHELKTPLSLIRLFGETLLLDRVPGPARAREYHEVIVRESERLTHLVSNVLDFAAMEGGKKTLHLRPASLGHVVEETLAAYRFQLEERGFQLETHIAPHLPEVLADPDAVAQAVINLLDNAVKYSSERKEIAVRVAPANGAVRISVADRGMGIAPRERKRVFDPFYRSPAVRGTRGSGLGLALVKRIVEAHGGSVELSSTFGEGSTFSLCFPFREEPGP